MEQEFKEYIKPFEERACRLALLPFEIRAAELALVPYEIRAGSWDESLHPRDSKGKFKAKNVQLFAGGGSSKNKLTNSGSGGTITVNNISVSDLIGIKAANGVVVTNVSDHAKKRMLQRSITVGDVKNTIVTPAVTYRSKTDDKCAVFDKGSIHIVLSDAGNIVTIARNGR